MSSKNITDTDARVLKGITNIVQSVYDKQDIDGKIKRVVSDNMITTGVMTKFYPYLNKCEVQLDTTDELVLCSIISLFSGDLLFFFTPSGEESFCETLREPCVIPRGKLNVLVANIQNDDYDYVMLGYFFPNDIIGVTPAPLSNFRISGISAVKEYSITFGLDGLHIVTGDNVQTTIVDDFEEDISVEQYSKSEIDSLLESFKEDLKKEILEELKNQEEDENDTLMGGVNV